jgi:hypothetical protein
MDYEPTTFGEHFAEIYDNGLKDRWAGWTHEPFTSASTTHVSVYGR